MYLVSISTLATAPNLAHELQNASLHFGARPLSRAMRESTWSADLFWLFVATRGRRESPGGAPNGNQQKEE